jgi:phosphatidylserine/phosphatidylglycerophosphate/cardiolipin synthase-like enzyme
MHHKFAVIDNKVVLTGSFNWTRNAAEDNHENIISIDSADMAVYFTDAWKKIK